MVGFGRESAGRAGWPGEEGHSRHCPGNEQRPADRVADPVDDGPRRKDAQERDLERRAKALAAMPVPADPRSLGHIRNLGLGIIAVHNAAVVSRNRDTGRNPWTTDLRQLQDSALRARCRSEPDGLQIDGYRVARDGVC